MTAEMLAVEREALAVTLRAAGSGARTTIEGWTAADLAAHVVATEKHVGVPTFLGRQLVARYGWRLNDTFRRPMELDRRWFARRGFEWALRRIERDGPALLARPTVLPVSLFEIFVHHEDVRRPNGLPRTSEPPALEPSIAWLLGYHRKLLGSTRLRVVLPDGPELWGGGRQPGVTVRGEAPEVLLWLAGRREVADVAVEIDPDAARDAIRILHV